MFTYNSTTKKDQFNYLLFECTTGTMDKVQTAGIVPHQKHIVGKGGIKIHKSFCGNENEIPADVRCNFLDKQALELAFIKECRGKKTC